MGVWTLAWPSIITNLFYATSSIVAIKVVGNLGPDAIAAAVTGQRVTFILQAVLTGVLAGSTALIARNWGANDKLEAGIFFTRTLQLVLFLSIISAMCVWQFAEPLVKFFGLKDQALVLSAQYLQPQFFHRRMSPRPSPSGFRQRQPHRLRHPPRPRRNAP